MKPQDLREAIDWLIVMARERDTNDYYCQRDGWAVDEVAEWLERSPAVTSQHDGETKLAIQEVRRHIEEQAQACNPIADGVEHDVLCAMLDWIEERVQGAAPAASPNGQDGASGGAEATERSKPRPDLRPVPGNGEVVDPLRNATPGSTTEQRSSQAYLAGYGERRAPRQQ